MIISLWTVYLNDTVVSKTFLIGPKGFFDNIQRWVVTGGGAFVPIDQAERIW